jgi:hydrogenase expression/formation protein HypD
MRYGIREMLPDNVRLISGPGCPVCVTPRHDIDCMIALAEIGIPVATYGDMLRVPGSGSSLEKAKASGMKVFEVYSAEEVLVLRKSHPEIVFFGIGFETTAPMTAYLLGRDVCVYSVHRLIPPAMKALLAGEVRIDGFIDPGHVATITGTVPFEEIGVAQAVAGFSPELVLRAVDELVRNIREGRPEVVNAYPEAVRPEGNPVARKLIDEVFEPSDSLWRGIGNIASSGLEVKDRSLDAKLKYKKIIGGVPAPAKTACRCADVLRGAIEPTGCTLYNVSCTPEDPKGACMVSSEGACAIYHDAGK